jgi:hypothetical protein
MWKTVVERLARLRSLDRQCQAFGASEHQYLLRPCLAANGIDAVENRLGGVLPDALKAFYTQVGNGIAGPNYGLKPSAELLSYRAGEDYRGVDALRQIASEVKTLGHRPDYFEVPFEELTGLLSVIDQGCGHQTCIVANGPKAGTVVYLSSDGFVVETKKSLVDIYLDWLWDEVKRFEAVQDLMEAGKSYQQIESAMIARFGDYNAGGRIASIANVKKPAELFGEGNHRIYHGASQHPWYENVLRSWQSKHLRI